MKHLGKWSVVALAVGLAVSGCGGGKAAAPADVPPVAGPVLLSVTASRPAGTLDSLPDLTWSLSGATGLSLLVRAQGPGASAPGVGFAGVRVASGAIRYLGSDGTWSETEVAYAAAAGASGTIHPTAPLRLEGEWRFDLLVKDAGGGLKALALAPVLLSATPLLRLSLSRRAAVDGDVVEGAVVLARGGVARPVRLLAWWQGPGGVAAPLPDSAPLAYDGPSADVRLPLLSRRLDGVAAGTWTLVARLYDGTTGAPLGYATQSLEVCGATAPSTGTVLASDGTPLGAGASSARLQAIGVDRPEGWSSAIGADGAFSLSLKPGAWLVSGTVVDGAGLHLVEERAIQVGCGVPAPLVLTAQPPVTGPGLARGSVGAAALESSLAGRVAVPLGGPMRRAAPATAPAPACQGFGGKTRIRVFTSTTATLDAMGGNQLMPRWVEALKSELQDRTSGDLVIVTDRSLTGYAKFVAEQMANGTDCTALMESLTAMAGDYAVILAFVGGYDLDNDKIIFTLQLTDVSTTRSLRSTSTRVPGAAAQQGGVVEAALGSMVGTFISSPSSLITYLRDSLSYPLEPRVGLTADFVSVTPGAVKTVTAHLEDCDGTTYPGRTLHLERKPIPFTGEVTAQTDASGNARFTVELGASTRQESLRASFLSRARQTYRSDEYGYGVNRGQLGQLRFSPGIPAIRPSTAAPVEVTSQDPTTGAPQAGQRVVFESTLGGVPQRASGTTDGAGAVAVEIAVGGAIGLGQVDAYVPPPTPSPVRRLGASSAAADPAPPPTDPGRVTEYLVVTSPVAFNVQGPGGNVPAGAVVALTGSLTLDDLPLPGTPVTITSSGPGELTDASLVVDANGAFETSFHPPPSGTGAATVTFSVVVEGQTVTREVTISWAAGPPQIAFNCPSLTSPYGTDLCTIAPDGTGQARVVVDGASPAWSHDRSRLAFSLHGALTIANPDGTGSVTVSLPAGATASSLSWSPDDTQLAFAEVSPVNPLTICFVGADGSGHHCLPSSLLNFNANGYVPSTWNPRPAWSPDGARIAFAGSTYQGAGPPANFAFTYDIYVINVDDTGASNVTMNSATVRGLNPAWSPDGTKLAYVREDGSTFKDDIYVTTPGGGAGTPVTSSGYADDPAWSPDGSRIAYADLSSLTVMIINADGSSVPTTLAPGSQPAW